MTPFRIAVVFASPEEGQVIESFEVPAGARVSDLLALDSVRQRFALPDGGLPPVGIFGRITDADEILKPGDRIELYRPLRADPKEARRLRGPLRRERHRAGSGR